MLVLFINAGVAQLVERLICNQLVGGSNPLASFWSNELGRYPSGQREQTVNLLAMPSEVQILLSPRIICGNSSVGRASAFQADCRGFEPRFPLGLLMSLTVLFFAHVAQWWSVSLVRKRSPVQSRSWAID